MYDLQTMTMKLNIANTKIRKLERERIAFDRLVTVARMVASGHGGGELLKGSLESLDESLSPLTVRTMQVCAICGNKRCPKALDKDMRCTNSNALDQVGFLESDSAQIEKPTVEVSSAKVAPPLSKSVGENARIRVASGCVNINSKLVSFIYELLRDELPAGRVEEIVRACTEPDVHYSNGWLASYAKDIADRLLDSTPRE